MHISLFTVIGLLAIAGVFYYIWRQWQKRKAADKAAEKPKPRSPGF